VCFSEVCKVKAELRWHGVSVEWFTGSRVGATWVPAHEAGYSVGEMQGRGRSMFVLQTDRDSTSYRKFWIALGAASIGRQNTANREGMLGGLNPDLIQFRLAP
jgi:hypothetical protein